MATRQQRIDAFIHEGEPPANPLLEVLATGARIEATIIGWRERVEAEDRLCVIDPSNRLPTSMPITEQASDPE